jgi:hypothetical protein
LSLQAATLNGDKKITIIPPTAGVITQINSLVIGKKTITSLHEITESFLGGLKLNLCR